ncbi:unnamed protein product [Meganyctiphanes norvegica]|uniref:P/Homo B domain-containing protein n=1 Tax=Meganyctiphanes norvegica TaxID=48144 RepID=A0AAV2QYL4_MEGNR
MKDICLCALLSSRMLWKSLAVLGLLWEVLLLMVVAAERESNNNNLHHTGELYHKRGSNVHSLAWALQLHMGCAITNVIGNLKRKRTWNQINKHYLRSNNKNSSWVDSGVNKDCLPDDIPKHIILHKTIDLPFQSVFIVAHPYFRTFFKYKRRKRHLKLRMQRNVFLNRVNLQNSNKFHDERLYLNESLKDDMLKFLRIEMCLNKYLNKHPCVKYSHQEVLRSRQKRRHIHFTDPLYGTQWHLKNDLPGEYDINVVDVWESGITGRGVTVCVIDDGLEWQHPDLRDNYNPAGSYDLNSDDQDPSPVKNGERNEHGTRCAGEIAAVANSVCGVGVAYRSNISGIRVLGGRMTDSMEAAAFIQGLKVNDVYSCSWGPDDDGKTVDGPHHLASKALLHGITYGRHGYGAIYVVASGNGGRNKDNCNFDGYANSKYTVTIGAVDSSGRMPYYAEECAAMLAVTPSSGSKGRDIVTTDWTVNSASGCTNHHSGTSAAAPLAAGVIALALEVQPCLSWRDVQYIIALTSKKIDVANADWTNNAAGLHHSHQHGFGLIDASALVGVAAVWETVPFSTTYTSEYIVENLEIPPEIFGEIRVTHEVLEETLKGYALNILEFVQVRVTVEHEFRGALEVSMVCPSGTHSTLASPRSSDNSSAGLEDWPFATVRCWGESPIGLYEIGLKQMRKERLHGKLINWQLILNGSPMTTNQFKQRKKIAEAAIRGEHVKVNRSRLCHPPEIAFQPFLPIPERWLKALIITSLFLGSMIIFNTIEYIFCYNDEKEKFYKKLKDLDTGRSLQRRTMSNLAVVDNSRYGSTSEAAVVIQDSLVNDQHEVVPLMVLDRDVVSPTLSCDADISSQNCDDSDDEMLLSSLRTSDTLIPKDTDNTDFTNDEFFSECDDDSRYVRDIKEEDN